MTTMTPYRFYEDESLLTKTNRDDAENIKPLFVEENIIPAFQVIIPYVAGTEDITFTLIDDDGNEDELTISTYEDVRILDNNPVKYITHPRETVVYDKGCYTARLEIGSLTFYGTRIQTIHDDDTETFHRLYMTGGKRLIDTTNKRITQ